MHIILLSRLTFSNLSTRYIYFCNYIIGYNLNEKSLSCQQKEIVTWHRFIEAFKFGFAKRTGLGDGDVENEAFREKLNEVSTDYMFQKTVKLRLKLNATHMLRSHNLTFKRL